jgi:hypothetical protein
LLWLAKSSAQGSVAEPTKQSPRLGDKLTDYVEFRFSPGAKTTSRTQRINSLMHNAGWNTIRFLGESC